MGKYNTACPRCNRQLDVRWYSTDIPTAYADPTKLSTISAAVLCKSAPAERTRCANSTSSTTEYTTTISRSRTTSLPRPANYQRSATTAWWITSRLEYGSMGVLWSAIPRQATRLRDYCIENHSKPIKGRSARG